MKKGQILVSNYTLVNDIEFNKTLILIVESNNEGIVGFVFNKESNYQLSEIDEKLRGIDLKIYKGGPVMIDSCLLYTSPSPRDKRQSRMPSSA